MASKKTPRYRLQSANQNSSDDEPPPAEPRRSRPKGSKRKCEKIVVKVPERCCESRNNNKTNFCTSTPYRTHCNSPHKSHHEHHNCTSKEKRVTIGIKRGPCSKCPCVGVAGVGIPYCQRTHASQQCNKGHGKAPTQCCHKKLQTAFTQGACVDKCLQTESPNSRKHKECQTITVKQEEKPCTKGQKVQCELMKDQEMSKIMKCKQTSTCRNSEELEENKSRGIDCGHIFPFLSSSEGYLLIDPKMISYENENLCMLTANACKMMISHKEWCEDRKVIRVDHHNQKQPCECQSFQAKPTNNVIPFAKKNRSPHSTVHHHRSTNTEAESKLPQNFHSAEDAFSRNVKDTLWTHYSKTLENLKALAANFPEQKYDGIKRDHHNQCDTGETEVNPTSRKSKKAYYSNDSHSQPHGHYTKTREYSSVPVVRNLRTRERVNTNNSYSHPQSNNSEGYEEAEYKPSKRTANDSRTKGLIGQLNSNHRSNENEPYPGGSEVNSEQVVRRMRTNSKVLKSHHPPSTPEIGQRNHQEKSNEMNEKIVSSHSGQHSDARRRSKTENIGRKDTPWPSDKDIIDTTRMSSKISSRARSKTTESVSDRQAPGVNGESSRELKAANQKGQYGAKDVRAPGINSRAEYPRLEEIHEESEGTTDNEQRRKESDRYQTYAGEDGVSVFYWQAQPEHDSKGDVLHPVKSQPRKKSDYDQNNPYGLGEALLEHSGVVLSDPSSTEIHESQESIHFGEESRPESTTKTLAEEKSEEVHERSSLSAYQPGNNTNETQRGSLSVSNDGQGALAESGGIGALAKSVGTGALAKSVGTGALAKSGGTGALAKSVGTGALAESVNPNFANEIFQSGRGKQAQLDRRNTKNSMFAIIDTPGSESEPQLNISRESLKQYKTEDVAAAVKLQKYVRGFLARKNMKERNEAAIKIQRAFREHLANIARKTEGDFSSSKGRNILKRTHSSDMLLPLEEVPSLMKNLDTPKGALLLFGGVDPSLPCSLMNTGREVYMYMADGNLWMRVGRMPEPRSHFGISRMNNDVYIVGGTDPRYKTENDRNLVVRSVWKVSLRRGMWMTDPDLPMDLPEPKSHFGCVSKGGIMYVVGGNDVNFRATETCLKYDTLTNMWSTIAELDSPRVSMGIAVFQERIWIAGGLSKNSKMPVYQSVMSYDVLSDSVFFYPSWHRLQSLPLPRAFCSLVVGKDRFIRLYIVGGAGPRDKYDKKNKSIPDILNYDPETFQWKPAGVLLNPRHGHAAAAIDDKIVILGGVISSRQVVTKSLEVFDISSSRCSEGRKLHQKLSGMGVVSLS